MKTHPMGFKIFVGAVIVGVLATLIAGLWISGSPAAERARVLDERRLQDLQSIASAIDNYYNQNNQQLPPTLATLTSQRDTYYVSGIADPDSNQPYEYTISSSNTYKLCATFSTDSHGQGANQPPSYPYGSSTFWDHGPEHTCFTITAKSYPTPVPTPK
jgi:type II secretory pathway pseudopilin PulG